MLRALDLLMALVMFILAVVTYVGWEIEPQPASRVFGLSSFVFAVAGLYLAFRHELGRNS